MKQMQDILTTTFDCPEYSFGNHFDDPKRVVIKVNEGKYKNTVFSYDNLCASESDVITYDLDLLTLSVDCDIIEVSEIPNEFIENVSNKILTDILIASVKRTTDEPGN